MNSHWSWKNEDGEEIESTQHDLIRRWVETVRDTHPSDLDEIEWFKDLNASLLEVMYSHMRDNLGWMLIQLSVPSAILETLELKMADFFYMGRLFERARQEGKLDG